MKTLFYIPCNINILPNGRKLFTMSERSLCHWTNSQYNSLPRTVPINICHRIGTLDINWETQIFIWKGEKKRIKSYLSTQGRKSFFLKENIIVLKVTWHYHTYWCFWKIIRCKFEEGYSLPENTNTCKWYCDKINISPLKKYTWDVYYMLINHGDGSSTCLILFFLVYL